MSGATSTSITVAGASNGSTFDQSNVYFTVASGGTMADDTFISGFPIFVSYGGLFYNDTLSATGVDLGGIAYGLVLDSGGSIGSFSPTPVVGTTINAGGEFINGTTADGVTINNGGTLIDQGAADHEPVATATSVVVESGGRFFDDGNDTGTVVSSGGYLGLIGGSSLSATILASGSMGLGGTAISTVISSGGSAAGGGYDSATQVLSGAVMSMGGGGYAISTTVAGSLQIYAGGAGVTAVSTTVSSGGSINRVGYVGVNYGPPLLSLASDTVLLSGASMVMFAYESGGESIASGTTVDSGATLYVGISRGVAGTPMIPDTPSATPATSNIYTTATDTTLSGGTLEIQPGGSATGALGFAAGGSVVVSGGAAFSATVSGLNTSGSVIDFRGLADSGGSATAMLNSTTDILTVSGDTTSATLQLASGSYAGVAFSAFADCSGGTLVQLACFARGTHIRTEAGEIPIETLAPGMAVALARGGFSRVTWVGHRLVNCQKHPRPRMVWPVHVAPDAFGPGVPARALVLSPDHAVWVAGALIPVRYLLNGASIAQVECASVEYWHIELPAHDVILAEGLAAESFLDTGNRGAFLNGGTATQLHPAFAQRLWDGEACAPLTVAGPALERARAGLRARPAAKVRPAGTFASG